MKKSIILSIILLFLIIFSSCSRVSESDYGDVLNAISSTNNYDKYKATFVLEILDASNEELVLFVQGSYCIDKSSKEFDGAIMNGELVQTVYNTPSSMKIGFYDDTYVTISNDYKILNDMDESELLKQFMFSPAISYSYDKINDLEISKVSNGTMYSLSAEDKEGVFLKDLLADDVYTFAKMKMPQKELTYYDDVTCKYVVDNNGLLSSRDLKYKIVAFDTIPYFPGHQASKDDYKREFSVSITLNYKAFGDDVSVDISEFLPEENENHSSEN